MTFQNLFSYIKNYQKKKKTKKNKINYSFNNYVTSITGHIVLKQYIYKYVIL